MDILTYALAKSYTDKALLGVGTIKGAPCTVKSQTEDDEYVYVTLGWENNLGTSEETVVKIKKGADGAPGEPGPAGGPGPQGVSITKIEKIKTEDLIDTYQISFSDNTTFEYTISNGSTNYLNITNKPSIEGVELIGNKTFKDLNIASADALTATNENLQNLSNLIGDKTSLPAPTDTIVNNITSVDAKVDAIIDDNETGLTKTFSSDKISKTFAIIEEVNKRIPQYDVLPAPTEAFGGKVVQFIGTTREDYIHNYFYECVEVESSYKWVNVVIQNVPTKVSELTNDSNFVTETELNEKGYLTEHQDLSAYATKDEIPTVPNKVSELTNDSNYQTAEQVNSTVTTEIARVVADAPEDLNTLKEMSDWIAEHEDDASAMNSAISDNKTAITALQTGKADKSEIPTTLPADGGNSDTVNNHTVETDVPADALFTDTIYDDTEVKESIAELNSNLDTLEYSEVTGGNNIFKANKNGYYDPSGNIIKSEQYVCSDIIPYEESVIYVSLDKIYSKLNDGNGAWIGFVLFDADKNYIENSYSSTYQRGRLKYSITVNSGTKYVAISKSKDANVCISSKDIDYEPYIPSVKMLAEEKADKSETTVNLLNPTLQTTTVNGITCTDNGDGTYTLNGTATKKAEFSIFDSLKKYQHLKNRTVKLVGCPKGGSLTTYMIYLQLQKTPWSSAVDSGEGSSITVDNNDNWACWIRIFEGATISNLVFKPMITTNLDATYDDFVPYTGDTGKLNSDVAAIKKDIGNLTGDIDAKTVNGHTVESNVPTGAKFTDTVYDDTSIQNKLTIHTHDDRYYTETEVNNLLNGKANSSHSHGAYELPVGSIFLSSRKVAPSYGNWEYLGTIQNLFSDLPLIQSIGEGYVYNRTS